jgi:hypothetical protein
MSARLVLAALVLAACVDDLAPRGLDGEPGTQGPEGPQGPAGPRGVVPSPDALVQNQTATAQPASFHISGSGAVTGGFHAAGGNGDVNGDGAFGAGDIAIIAEYLNGARNFSIAELQRADIDGDGQVTALDADRLRELALGTSTIAHAQTEGRRLVDRSAYGLFTGTGDVNRDGDVNAGDAAAIASYINGGIDLSATQRRHADVNGDGRIDLIDVQMITELFFTSPVSFDNGRRPADTAWGADLNGYFVLGKKTNGVPAAGHCTANTVGAMALDPANSRLYVCGAAGWRFATLTQ